MRQLGLLLLAPLLITCAVSPVAPSAPQKAAPNNHPVKRAEVTLDIYSGRENPSWELSGEQLDALTSALDGLPVTERADFFDGLGYRGFTAVINDAAEGKTERVKAYKGLILRSSGGAEMFLKDKDRGVEKLLLESGERHLKAELRESLRVEVEPRP